jgi:hypothetical protein
LALETFWVSVLAKHVEPVADVYAYCVLRNHFHLEVRIKSLQEIPPTSKTLKVFAANGKHAGQNPPAARAKIRHEDL